MPQELEALLRRLMSDFNKGGIDAVLGYLDPEIEWVAPPEWLEDRVYSGHEGIRRLAEFWSAQFDEYRVHPDEFVHLPGGRLLVLLHQSGRIRASDDAIDQPVAWIVEARDRKLTRVEVFFSWEAARQAVGVGQ
jgi:ketosteroid isomerase-like protein